MVTEDRVAELVDVHMTGPIEYGASDCCMAAANVFRDLTGLDMMAPWRGRYRDEAVARAILKSGGGLLRLVRHRARALKLRHGCGRAGEIGVVRGDNGDHVLAVCLGRDIWAGRIDGGYQTVQGAVTRCRV